MAEQRRYPFPEGAADCHVHVFGPVERFPIAPSGYTPPDDTPVEALFAMWDRFGIARGVIVHALTAGPDNAATEDALRRFPDRLRGIALLSPDVSEARLDALTEAGFRGVRINLMRQGGRKLYSGGMTIDDLIALAPRIAARGWHAQIWVNCAELAEIAPRIEPLPLDFVIDHMGRGLTENGTDFPGFQHLLRLLGTGRYWCKISGADRISSGGAPYRDAAPFQRALVDANPERIVWGTDWPHVNFPDGRVPTDEDLVRLFFETVTDDATRRRILVENPARLYGF